MKAQSTIEEVISAGVGIMITIVLIYTFYVTPSPIQQYFQNLINSIIIGVAVVIGTIVAVIVLFKIRHDS